MGIRNILLSLDKNCQKCSDCKKLFHREKTAILMRKVGMVSLFDDCFLCGWGSDYVEILMREHDILMKEIEESFGNLYEIQYTIDPMPMFTFTEKTDDSSI